MVTVGDYKKCLSDIKGCESDDTDCKDAEKRRD